MGDAVWGRVLLGGARGSIGLALLAFGVHYGRGGCLIDAVRASPAGRSRADIAVARGSIPGQTQSVYAI